MRFAFIAKSEGLLPIKRLCQIMDVSPRGYRAWRTRPMSKTQLAATALPDFPGYVGTSAVTALSDQLISDHMIALRDAGSLAPTDAADTSPVAVGSVEDIVLYAEVSLA